MSRSSGGRLGARRPGAFAALAAAALVIAACGGDDDGDAAATEPVTGSETATGVDAGDAALGGGTSSVPAGETAATDPAGTGGGTTTGGTGAGTGGTAIDEADVDPDGVLRSYYDLVLNGGPEFDPTKGRISQEQYLSALVYGNLFALMPDGELEPRLAESAAVVDPQTVRVELFDGVEFSDGTPFDAEAVKFGVERQLAAAADNPVLASSDLRFVDSVTADSPTTFTLHLSAPVAGVIYDALPHLFTIVSPAAVASGVDLSTNPVGAGPFLLEDYRPGQYVRYTKNPGYFRADEVRLAGMEFIHAEYGQAQLTAILSDAVDISGEAFSYAQSKEIGSSGWEIGTNLSGSVQLEGQMCKNRPPFDDVRVRQALNYAIDREAINDAVFDGEGAPMWSLWPEGHRLHDAELDGSYAYDPDRARELLAEAGMESFEFDSFFVQTDRVTEIVQAQLADVGVTMNILPYTAGGQEFYPDGANAEMNLIRFSRTGIAKVGSTLTPPSIGNVCGYDDPELNALVQTIQGLDPTDPAALEAWGQVQELVVGDALKLFVAFEPEAIAWNPERVGNVSFKMNLRGERGFDFEKMYIRN